jgi:ligand-binding SRPBCC domain-containing protein
VKLRRLKLSQAVPRPIEEVFEFFADPCNLQRLTPAFLHFHFLREPPPLMQAGTILDNRVRLYGASLRWVTVIDEFESAYRFVDSQMRGPYPFWRHTHVFEAVSKDATLIHDLMEYRMPLGLLGDIAHELFVVRILQRIFDFRATEIRRLLGESARG